MPSQYKFCLTRVLVLIRIREENRLFLVEIGQHNLVDLGYCFSPLFCMVKDHRVYVICALVVQIAQYIT